MSWRCPIEGERNYCAAGRSTRGGGCTRGNKCLVGEGSDGMDDGGVWGYNIVVGGYRSCDRD